MSQLGLDLGEIAVHCFWHCGHVVRDLDPEEAHRRMEAHYRDTHGVQLAFLVPRLRGCHDPAHG